MKRLPKHAKLTTALLGATTVAACSQTVPQSRGLASTPARPNIDRLAARGTRFEQAYANQAVCAPSRINLMTSRRSTSTGIYDFGMDLRRYIPGAVTLPQLFKQSGYRAESIGTVYQVGHGSQDDLANWSSSPVHDKVIEYVDPASTGGASDARGKLDPTIRWETD